MINMKIYFNLKPTVYFLEEESESVLYNTITGDVIKLTKEQTKELKKAINGLNSAEKAQINYDFFDELVDKKIGTFDEYNINIEETYWGTNKYFEKLSNLKKQIEILQIEITNRCDFNCQFCDVKSDLIYRKTGCKKWKLKNKELNEKDILSIIQQITKLGCKRIEIFGGNPFIEWDKLKYLIEVSRKLGINDIVVYTNGTHINNEKIEYLTNNSVKCILQILGLQHNKKMIGVGNDVDYTYIIDFFNKKKLSYIVKLLIYRENELYVEQIINYLVSNNVRYYLDFIYKKPDNNFYSTKYLNIIEDYKSNLVRCNPYNLGLLMLENPCFYNRIAISADGFVYPCIMLRLESYGDIRERKLSNMLDKKYDYYKYLSKEKYSYCNKCLYRYSCVTCSAMDISASYTKVR